MLMQAYNDVLKARELDKIVVSSAIKFKEALLELYQTDGWEHLGYTSWGNYLEDVGKRAQYSTQMLRRWTNAAMLASASHIALDKYSESALRQITEGLSDNKGYTQSDRVETLLRAVEYAGEDEDVSERHTKRAVAYKIVEESGYDILSNRMRSGFLNPEKALQISNVLNASSKEDEPVLHGILEFVSDPRLAKTLHNIAMNNGEIWGDVSTTIMATGFVPTASGDQVHLDTATNEHLIGYLNKPASLARASALASEREQELAKWKLAFASVYDALKLLLDCNDDMFGFVLDSRNEPRRQSPEGYGDALDISEKALEETRELRSKVKTG
jgi:hypothetical protein